MPQGHEGSGDIPSANQARLTIATDGSRNDSNSNPGAQVRGVGAHINSSVNINANSATVVGYYPQDAARISGIIMQGLNNEPDTALHQGDPQKHRCFNININTNVNITASNTLIDGRHPYGSARHQPGNEPQNHQHNAYSRGRGQVQNLQSQSLLGSPGHGRGRSSLRQTPQGQSPWPTINGRPQSSNQEKPSSYHHQMLGQDQQQHDKHTS